MTAFEIVDLNSPKLLDIESKEEKMEIAGSRVNLRMRSRQEGGKANKGRVRLNIGRQTNACWFL